MKIRKSFEQAICILLLIGAQDKPIKSHELSEKLLVSDSYLKKITRQLRFTVIRKYLQQFINNADRQGAENRQVSSFVERIPVYFLTN